MKPVAWRYENKNVKGNWYITWTEPPDGFNKRPLYEHPPQDAANSCLYEDTKKLEQQLAASEQDRQDQIDLTIARAEEVKQLRQQLAEAQKEYGRACHLVAQMHAAAVGEVTAPKLGVVEDVAEVRQQLDTAWEQAHRLAHKLECLIMDTKDNAIVSKWWDSAFEAMEEYNNLRNFGCVDKSGQLAATEPKP